MSNSIQKRLSQHLEKAHSTIAARQKFTNDLASSIDALKSFLAGFYKNPNPAKLSDALTAINDIRLREEILAGVSEFNPEKALWDLINSNDVKRVLIELLTEKEQAVRDLWKTYRRTKAEAALLENSDQIYESDNSLRTEFNRLEGFDGILKSIAGSIAHFPPSKNQPGVQDYDFIVSELSQIT